MSAEPDRLESLVAAVSDGEKVGWEAEIARAPDGRQRALIESLQIVSGVATVHRSLEPEEGAVVGVSTRGADTDTVGAPSPPRLSAEEPDSPVPRRWGPLEIIERIGKGGFGEVFRARDARLDREVALKLLSRGESACAAEASAVVEEGRLLARVRHPNVALVHGAEEHDGRVGIWMELVQGRTLEQLLGDHGALGPREASLIGMDLCRALTAVHRAGVVHRDVKAENVMRGEGGRILLVDFGTGMEVRRAGQAGGPRLAGTPLYMAPEVLQGGRVTAQADIYSLGVLLFHLVTGSYPIEARSLKELLDRHKRGETRLLREVRPDLPEGFLRVVERALSPKPEARFQTAGQMEQVLAMSLGLAAGGGQVSRGRVSRVGLLAAAAVALGLAVAALSLLWPGLRAPAGGLGTTAPASSPSGAGDPLTARLLEDGAYFATVGAYGEARSRLEEALARQERSLSPGDPAIARSLARLGLVVLAGGSDSQAKARFERALGILLAHPGMDDRTMLMVLGGLAAVNERLGDTEEARRLRGRASGIERADRGRPPVQELTLGDLDSSAFGLGLYRVQAALYRQKGGGREPLRDGIRVAPGDKLYLELRPSVGVHVYVINEDDRGEVSLLFPLPGFEPGNPLPAGRTIRLPGRLSGRPIGEGTWEVSSVGGREHFLIVASPVRLVEFEDALRALPLPRVEEPAAAVNIPEATLVRLRGIGRRRGISKISFPPRATSPAPHGTAPGAIGSPREASPGSPGGVVPGAPARLFDLAAPLSSAPEVASGVWIRKLDLENPGS